MAKNKRTEGRNPQDAVGQVQQPRDVEEGKLSQVGLANATSHPYAVTVIKKEVCEVHPNQTVAFARITY